MLATRIKNIEMRSTISDFDPKHFFRTLDKYKNNHSEYQKKKKEAYRIIDAIHNKFLQALECFLDDVGKTNLGKNYWRQKFDRQAA